MKREVNLIKRMKVMKEPKNVTIDVTFMIGNLTMNIILDKPHANDFIKSLNKLLAKINECSTE